ncbi:penicillin-binding protein 1C [Segetibacter aerophilus]|uniref:penicillin-binding protein 1C n=1 Tax=Segetibacter aerophilus TaxID=670293 RepID=UPI001FE618F5|nr:transglycosylase domain-containing protein [Segetibacter aerophilus]
MNRTIGKIKSVLKKRKITIAVAAVLLLWFAFSLPKKLFDKPTSFVLEDADGNLLSASIATDGQWRFPYNQAVPDKFFKCITTFEDKRFSYHPGIDPIALTRAIYQNLKGKKVISGGSTLTMQVIRLSRGEKRNLWQKLLEGILAVRLECFYSKKSILAIYASNAPFGSNVVGLDAAAWRYFGRSADKLSWGEMAALAVLPNAPTLVHPGKNRQTLLRKRNELVDKLVSNKTIDATTGELAKMEPLPGQPLPLPQLAPHLLDRFKKEYKKLHEENTELSTRITTTVQSDLQQSVTQIINRYQSSFRGNGINNAAAMVMEVETGNVLAYVGNVYNPSDPELESHVDVLASPRSPGSTLKPLLFAAMQTDGLILPQQLVPDIPTQIGGYTPQNFNLDYDGAVPANRALSRSLNIPAVKMLQQYKYQRFYDVLKQCGFTTLKQPADHYGLSLILGGCEVTPWELAGVYSSLARTYNNQRKNNGKMIGDDWRMPKYFESQAASHKLQAKNKPTSNKTTQGSLSSVITQPSSQNSKLKTQNSQLPFDFTSLWHTFNAMQEVMRPGEEGLWNLFNSAQRIAWKTGTSFGFRDGWAIGLTSEYCVVAWVGNTDGEGRPELTGINTAAPVMFDIFRLLPSTPWFEPPGHDFTYLPICHQSGYKAGPDCNDVDTMMVSINGKNATLCPFHHIIHLDHTATYRTSEGCETPSEMVHKTWFTLPPAMEYYYKAKHQDYQQLPPYLPGCNPNINRQMEMIYPEPNAVIYVPMEVTGQKGRTVFKATHRNANEKLYWHLDDNYVGTTQQFHQLAVNPSKGSHTITIVDHEGETITRSFKILEKERH